MHNISVSTWNIHGLFHKTLGDKTKNKDFINNISKLDFFFLTETWSNLNINIPGYKAFVSYASIPQTDKACRISGGITLLYKSHYQKHVSIAKKSKPATYLSDHSQIISWFNIQTISDTEEPIHQEPTLHKLPLQFDWSENPKTNFKKALRSPETQNKISEFLSKNFSSDINGINECKTDFQNILSDASKKSLKLRRKKH